MSLAHTKKQPDAFTALLRDFQIIRWMLAALIAASLATLALIP